jgi:hypothetical protein
VRVHPAVVEFVVTFYIFLFGGIVSARNASVGTISDALLANRCNRQCCFSRCQLDATCSAVVQRKQARMLTHYTVLHLCILQTQHEEWRLQL